MSIRMGRNTLEIGRKIGSMAMELSSGQMGRITKAIMSMARNMALAILDGLMPVVI